MGVSVSVERLRVWLLVGAVLLVTVIVAFLWYAHYRAHQFLTELPRRLGADIRQETNAFTWSQSDGKRTIYTIHAAKAIQHKNGQYTLRDVGVVLYGRKQDRADRIYGNEFEYDQNAGMIRAVGEVHIDLEAPAAKDPHAKMDYAAGKDLHAAGEHEVNDAHLIHVVTSGLVYLEKLGVAATDQGIEFEAGGITGHAVGADYNADTGLLVLHSEVRATGLQRGQPVVLTAARAELDRLNQQVVLSQAKYVSVGSERSGGGETAEAQRVVVHLRTDGTAERVEAEGAVTLKSGDGETVTAPRGEVALNAENRPQSALMSGGVRFGTDEPLRHANGDAAEARTTFDKAGRLKHVVLTGGVHLKERLKRADVSVDDWTERELSAEAVELALDAVGAGKAQLRDAKATGSARLQVTEPAGSKGSVSSSLSGDVLTTHFVLMDGANHLAEVHGDGHALLRRVNATGVVNTSSGDLLEAHFRPMPSGAGRRAVGATNRRQESGDDLGKMGSDELDTAVEQGHVVMTQQPVRKAGETVTQSEERAVAERSVYDGELERLTLTGKVEVTDAESTLWADRVVSDQRTGDAMADGSVKVSYLPPKNGVQAGGGTGAGGDPVHVMAARAELNHASQVAIFHGVTGRPARLWQGASQVEAPVLQFEQKERRLVAKGDGQGAGLVVHTVLVSGSPAARAETTKVGAVAQTGKTEVLRVASTEMTYSDETRKAEFTGGVQMDSSDGSMRGQLAVVYLQTAGKADAGSAQAAGKSGFMGGSVERVVASGHIVLDQPGRRATGEQVVYTASDGMFLLTGTADKQPKVVDEQRGTVTGTSLRFHAGDESVVVSNGVDGGAGQRVRTETRVKK